MSYTNSQAQTGLGSNISINTGTGTTPTWTQIFEITSAKMSGRQAKTVDVTNLQSTAAEFITTLVDSGTFDCSGNRVTGDPGQSAVEAAFSGLLSKQYKITLPKTAAQVSSGDSYTFNAVVQEWAPISDVGTDKAVQFSLKLKISNTITFTAGS